MFCMYETVGKWPTCLLPEASQTCCLWPRFPGARHNTFLSVQHLSVHCRTFSPWQNTAFIASTTLVIQTLITAWAAWAYVQLCLGVLHFYWKWHYDRTRKQMGGNGIISKHHRYPLVVRILPRRRQRHQNLLSYILYFPFFYRGIISDLEMLKEIWNTGTYRSKAELAGWGGLTNQGLPDLVFLEGI